jgi:hypothetical protein
MFEGREYDGTPSYTRGAPMQPRRDAIKITHRETVKTFKDLGNQALNAADYERTMHLPVGKGRLACDPDTGEFDKDADRPVFNPDRAPRFPRHLHSTVTEGESTVVYTEEEYAQAKATRKWSDTPLERKRRFTLTDSDQMQNLKGEILAERARGLQQDRRIEELLMGSTNSSDRDDMALLASQLREEKEARRALEVRLDEILQRIDRTPISQETDNDDISSKLHVGKNKPGKAA